MQYFIALLFSPIFVVILFLVFITVLANVKDRLIGLHSTLLALDRPIIVLLHVVHGDILAERNALLVAADLNMT